MSKPLVIYHANCADGFGAAFAAWLSLGDEAEYVPMSYGEQPLDFEGRDVYILDFSFPRETMDRIFANAKRVVWLDHHKTAFEMWRGSWRDGDEYHFDTCHEEETTLPYIVLASRRSGAMLAWEYFHPGTEVPMLIQHIDDYDRWQFKIEGTKAFTKALWSYAPWSFEQWHNVLVPDMYREGQAILRAHDQNVQSVVQGAARKCAVNPGPLSGAGLPGLSANCSPHLTSDVGHALATQSGTFGLCWCLAKEGMIAKCSLRSNGDYDVSAIAKAFSGGGHRNAAGFEVDVQTLLGWLK